MTTDYRASTPETSADFYRNAPHNTRADTNPLPDDNTPDSEKLMDRFAAKMRALHYSLSTEKVYRHWIVQFLRFHRRGRQWRHPAEMGKTEIEAFLAHLAVARNVNLEQEEAEVAESTANELERAAKIMGLRLWI